MNENNSSNEDENDFNIYEKKAKNWILISTLENSLYNSIKEISHFQESANNNLIENTLFINILKDLDKFDFTKVFNEDYEKYLAYLDKNKDEVIDKEEFVSQLMELKYFEIEKYAIISNQVEKKLIDTFMPGPITVILKKKDIIPSCVTALLGAEVPTVQPSLICKLMTDESSFIDAPFIFVLISVSPIY